jgi:hypothetical protein
MKREKYRLITAVVALMALVGCTNDAASFRIDGREHALSMIREQTKFWEKSADFFIVAARLPDCQRRHRLGHHPLAQSTVEIWQTGGGTYVARQGPRMYLLETRTCEGFQLLDAEPPGGLGQLRGRFRDDGKGLHFVPEAGVAAAN